MTQTKKESATQTRLRCMEDRQFRRWYETLSLKSENTAHSYRQWAVRLTRLVDLDPLSYVALYREDPDAFDDVNQDIVNAMVRAGRAESTVITCISAIKSWAAWSRCKFGRTLVIGKAPRAPVASKQRIPSQAGLRLVLDHLDPRSRACLGFRAAAARWRYNRSPGNALRVWRTSQTPEQAPCLPPHQTGRRPPAISLAHTRPLSITHTQTAIRESIRAHAGTIPKDGVRGFGRLRPRGWDPSRPRKASPRFHRSLVRGLSLSRTNSHSREYTRACAHVVSKGARHRRQDRHWQDFQAHRGALPIGRLADSGRSRSSRDLLGALS